MANNDLERKVFDIDKISKQLREQSAKKVNSSVLDFIPILGLAYFAEIFGEKNLPKHQNTYSLVVGLYQGIIIGNIISYIK